MFAEQARHDHHLLETGQGQQPFRATVAKIEARVKGEGREKET